MQSNRNILITGGAGFIGSHVVRRFVQRYPNYRIICLDSLTYAGNLMNLSDLEGKPNFRFVKGDICDYELVSGLLCQEKVDGVIHLAAESHVDRSIDDPLCFARTNVLGTLTLLQAARNCWQTREHGFEGTRFYHISTDEVYGALPLKANNADSQDRLADVIETRNDAVSAQKNTGDRFSESTPYRPHSPYSASKAGADHFVRAFADTYGMDTVISNCSNNYGPYQFPEKLIPLTINNIKGGREIPVYGKGENVRDWLYVEDHAEAIDTIFHKGRKGQTYCIGGDSELSNIALVREIIDITDRLLGREKGASQNLIRFVADRPGHDLRYAIDHSLLTQELAWKPRTALHDGVEKTVRWYLEHSDWLEKTTSGEYRSYYEKMYSAR